MQTFSQNFQSHIARSATTLCWAWQLTRMDGVVMGFTDHDEDMAFAGINHQAETGFSASDIENRLGFSLNNSAVQGVLSADVITDADINAGLYDGAAIKVFRVNWRSSNERGLIWSGQIGDISLRDGMFEAELIGKSIALDRSTGRVFSRLCDASFGDERCTVNTANFPADTICPRTFTACREQFQNTQNFRGFPYLIGDDAIYAGPREGDVRDGSSRYDLL